MTASIEVHEWQKDSYKPLIFTDDWQVAILNWEDQFQRTNMQEVERHNHTDEVFILLKGKAALFTRHDNGPLIVTEMQSGKLYNVPTSVWHNLLATPDVSLAIVENRDTHLNDTELRHLTTEEFTQLDTQLPDWA